MKLFHSDSIGVGLWWPISELLMMFLHNSRIPFKKLAVLLGLSVFIVSCDHRDPPRRIDNAFVNTINEYLKDEQLRYGCVEYGKKFKRNLRDNSGEYVKDPCKEGSDSDITGEAQEKELIRIRNRFIDRAILGINANYNDFVVALAERRSTGNFIADLIQITLGSVVGVIDDTKTLQILGVSLTGFTAARSSYDINFYQEQTTPVLISAMDTGRSNALNIIMQSKYDKEAKRDRNTIEYSLYAAINDIVDYYNAGTIVRGFVELNRNSTELARAAKIQVLNLRGVDAPFAEVPSKPVVDAARDVGTIQNLFRAEFEKHEIGSDEYKKVDDDFAMIINKLIEAGNNSFIQAWNSVKGLYPNSFEKYVQLKRCLGAAASGYPFKCADVKVESPEELVVYINQNVVGYYQEIFPNGYPSP